MNRLYYLLAVVALSSAGCSDMVTVKGQLTENGVPVRFKSNGGTLSVEFMPVPKDGGMPSDIYSGEVIPSTGEFEVLGRGQKGILPGTYHITFEREGGAARQLKLPQKALVREVDGSFMEIDLAKSEE